MDFQLEPIVYHISHTLYEFQIDSIQREQKSIEIDQGMSTIFLYNIAIVNESYCRYTTLLSWITLSNIW
jgi:hypothetical protein